MCASLHHKNILPFYGYVFHENCALILLSPLQRSGCATEFLPAHPDVDRLRLVMSILELRDPWSCSRCQQVSEIADGVAYLHSRRIIHGDIKGRNVLVSYEDGHVRPLICDFGSSRELDSTDSTTIVRGTLPWMAPELLRMSKSSSKITIKSDVWAWAMTVYVRSPFFPPWRDLTNALSIGASHGFSSIS